MGETLVTPLVGLFAASIAIAWILTHAARRMALRIGYVDTPGERKIHAAPTPYGGGMAIAATALGVPCILTLAWQRGLLAHFAPALALTLGPFLEQAQEDGTLSRLLAILAGGAGMFLLGLYDDFRGLNPKPKLLVQILIATAVVTGADVRATFFVESVALTSAVTVLWIVAITNAFNLLDNMDGLSAGIAAIASLLFLVVALQGDAIFVAIVLTIFAGTLLGFLWHNFPPARLFMGDAGSLYVGFSLACLTIAGTYYEGRGSLYAICMPVLILGVPIFDTASVLLIRWKNRRPLFVGDTNHISHRLTRLGMTRREAVLTIYLLGLILGASATLLRQLSPGGAVVVLLMGMGIVILMVLLEKAASRLRDKDPE